MRSRWVLAGLAACLVTAVLAPSALAAPASISPSHLTAGKLTTITVTASACSAGEIQISGPAIGGTVTLSNAGHPAHVFAGKVLVSTSAGTGTRTLSLRCSGGNLGSVTVKVAHGSGSGGSGSGKGSGKHTPPAGTLIARIGWHYIDDSVFPTAHAGDVTIHWGSCAKLGGTVIAFPAHLHLYPFDDPRSEKKGFLMATISGPPEDPSDPFKVHMYVGDLAHPHTQTITLRCMRLQNGGHSGPLVTAFTGKLTVKYVHQDINFDPAHLIDAMPEFGLEQGATTSVLETNLACAEIGTQTISLTSDAFAPNPAGGHTVVFTRTPGTQHNVKLAAYSAQVTTAAVPNGTYPVTVTCGTGQVGVGKILVS
jgi:hypothetical protein